MISRRQLLGTGGLLSLPGILSTATTHAQELSLRAIHITDVHITHEHDAVSGVVAMFDHASKRKPDLILNTGDSVMAVNGKITGVEAARQIDLWKKATVRSPAPILSCLGNHDVWDGNQPTDRIPIGKKGFSLMTEVLQMPSPYFAVEKKGWRFISLNSVSNWPSYGTLSKEQFDWLALELPKSSLPTCVLSHLPIVSVTSTLYGNDTLKGKDLVVPSAWQHADCWAISELFRKNPCVKLCLSGHMHTCDRCEYRGVWYICGGAISGAWWEGSQYGFPPCYGAIDFYPNGSFTYEFVDYEWKAREWKGKEWGK